MTTRPVSPIRYVAGTVLALGVLAGCAGAPPATAPATSTPAASSAPAPASSAPMSPSSSAASGDTADAATLQLRMADTPLGSILVDGRGMTLYMFTKDSPNTSVCEGQCLANWPPLLGVPTEGEGVDDSKLGSFTRADGTTQATYNGWPLYYWIKDTAPGDTTGQDVQQVWYVLDRDGEPVT